MKHRIERRKPWQVFFPLQRVMRGETAEGTAFRVVEGHAFVNEWVGDGVNLKRSAMMAASDDYMTWGAVREMHQPSAVGTAIGTVAVRNDQDEEETLALGVTWDDKGAFLRVKVVDSAAIIKLDEGVYRGFSVGVKATIMRGNNIEACSWIENSLVDRPADSGAGFTAIRVDTAQEESDVIRYFDGPMTFGQVQSEVQERDLYDDIWSAFYAFMECCWTIMESGGDAALLTQNLDEFTAYIKGHVFPEAAASEMEERAANVRKALDRMKGAREALESLPALTTRADQAGTELTSTRAALETAEVDLKMVRAELATAQAEVERLRKLPDPSQARPVKFAGAERTFAANLGASDSNEEQDKLQADLARLQEEAKNAPDDATRTRIATDIMRIQGLLRK